MRNIRGCRCLPVKQVCAVRQGEGLRRRSRLVRLQRRHPVNGLALLQAFRHRQQPGIYTDPVPLDIAPCRPPLSLHRCSEHRTPPGSPPARCAPVTGPARPHRSGSSPPRRRRWPRRGRYIPPTPHVIPDVGSLAVGNAMADLAVRQGPIHAGPRGTDRRRQLDGAAAAVPQILHCHAAAVGLRSAQRGNRRLYRFRRHLHHLNGAAPGGRSAPHSSSGKCWCPAERPVRNGADCSSASAGPPALPDHNAPCHQLLCPLHAVLLPSPFRLYARSSAGRSRRPKYHRMSSAMRRQACPSP